MSIHKLFGANLREECLRFASIAEVCRGADINRQQFNKYLSGQAMPNPRTLARLCSFLGVEEAKLFERRGNQVKMGGLTFSVAPGPANVPLPSSNTAGSKHMAMLQSLPSIHPSTLRSGYYFCYFPLDGYQNFLVRTVIKTGFRNNQFYFSRRTSVRTVSGPDGKLVVGKHSGFITADLFSNYLIGSNTVYPNEVSILKLQKSPIANQKITGGNAMIYSNPQNIITPFWIEWVGGAKSDARYALKQIGIVPVGHETVGNEIRSAFVEAQKKSSRIGEDAPQEDRKILDHLPIGAELK